MLYFTFIRYCKVSLAVTASLLLLRCQTTNQPTDSLPSDTTRIPVSAREPGLKPEGAVRSMLLWLKQNPEKAYDSSCMTMDGLDVIRIDTACLKSHLSSLEATSLFSKTYLNKLHHEYSAMGMEIEKGGYTSSKDYDIYFNSQDPPALEEALLRIDKAKTEFRGDSAIVSVNFKAPLYTLNYYLKKENGEWKITRIE